MNNLDESKSYRKALPSYILMGLLLLFPINWISHKITGMFEDKEQVALYKQKIKEAEEEIQKQKEIETKKHNEIFSQLHTKRLALYAQYTLEKDQSIIKKQKALIDEIDEKIHNENVRYKNLPIFQFHQLKVDVKKRAAWIDILENIIVILLYCLLFYNIRQQRISFNKYGVWAELGIFPWTRGMLLVKWEDIERVGYSQNPIGYLFGSANVHIIRRYTNEETIIKGVYRGKEFSGIATKYKYTEIDRMT